MKGRAAIAALVLVFGVGASLASAGSSQAADLKAFDAFLTVFYDHNEHAFYRYSDHLLKSQCRTFLEDNARSAWDHRRPDGTIGSSWLEEQHGVIEGFAAGTGAAVILHAQFVR